MPWRHAWHHPALLNHARRHAGTCPFGTESSSEGAQQLIRFSSEEELSGEFLLRFTTDAGARFETHALSFSMTAEDMATVLNTLPERTLGGIEVEELAAGDETPAGEVLMGASRAYLIKFSNEFNPGEMRPLEVETVGCQRPGCSPMYTGVLAGNYTVAVERVPYDGNALLPCSNRGTCDHDTGLCRCFGGNAGDACALQTTLI